MKRRVLLVNGIHALGGAERFASILLKHLDRTKFTLGLCVLQRDSREYEIPGDVVVFSLEDNPSAPKVPWSRVMEKLRHVRRLRKVIDTWRPDVVISLLDFLSLIVGMALPSCQHSPKWIARTGNNPRHSFRGWRGRIRHFQFRRVYPKAHLRIANSRALTESLNAAYPRLKSRIVHIPNPVDIEVTKTRSLDTPNHAKPQAKPLLVYMARYSPQKRFDILLNAMVDLKSKCDFELWLCGSGKMKPVIQSMIMQRALQDQVKILGHQSNPFPILKMADIVVSTSEFEGLPNALLEAQALGTPVIAADCKFGPSDIIENGETGFLVPVGDSQTLVARILGILSDSELRRRMSDLAPRSIEKKFSITQVLPMWEREITKLFAHDEGISIVSED